jgi:bacillopeptidase F
VEIWTSGKDTQTSSEKPAYVAPPTLNDTFSATNSATVSLSGSSIKNAKITLFVNNAQVDTKQVNSNNTFSFDSVRLTHGDNSIKVQAEISGVKSDFSNAISISYLNKSPELSLDTPSDGTEFHKDQKSVDIKGKTDPGIKVTVNDFWAIVDTDGNYSYTLPLHDGDNDIKVIASDDAGNKTEKDIKVKYSQ